nr:hypothetical protein [Luteipulveratus halotolerans]
MIAAATSVHGGASDALAGVLEQRVDLRGGRGPRLHQLVGPPRVLGAQRGHG